MKKKCFINEDIVVNQYQTGYVGNHFIRIKIKLQDNREVEIDCFDLNLKY